MKFPVSHILSTMLAATFIGLAAAPAAGQHGLYDDGGGEWRTRLVVSGGPVQLNIDAWESVGDFPQVSDDRTQLFWSFISKPSKVTVRTHSPGQRYSLEARASSVRNGSSTGSVRLYDGMSDRDLVVGIDAGLFGRATVVFTASASLEDGSSSVFGPEVHSITFTITEL